MQFVLVVYGVNLDHQIPVYYGPFESPEAVLEYATSEGLQGWDIQPMQRP